MHPKMIFLFFCFLYNFAWGGDSLVSFHGSRISLPNGYSELPADQLLIFKSTIFDREIMTVYEKNDRLTGIQRIIFYYDSLPRTKNFTFEKNVDLKLEVIKESGITFTDIKIHELNHSVYGNSIISSDTSIFGFSLDGYGIMGIQFDNSSGIHDTDRKNFEQLIKSINHTSPYQYLPEENPKAIEAKKEMESSGMLMTIAFVFMILIWLVRRYAIKNK